MKKFIISALSMVIMGHILLSGKCKTTTSNSNPSYPVKGAITMDLSTVPTPFDSIVVSYQTKTGSVISLGKATINGKTATFTFPESLDTNTLLSVSSLLPGVVVSNDKTKVIFASFVGYINGIGSDLQLASTTSSFAEGNYIYASEAAKASDKITQNGITYTYNINCEKGWNTLVRSVSGTTTSIQSNSFSGLTWQVSVTN